MTPWLSPANPKRLLRFQLRSLMAIVAFAGVLMGWWSDRLRLEERIQQRDDLLRVLQVSTPQNYGAGFWASPGYVAMSILRFRRVDDFVASLRDGKGWTRPNGDLESWMLAEQSPKRAIPQLVTLMKDSDPEVRRRAIQALRQIGDLPLDVALPLAARAEDACPEIRMEAIRSLLDVAGTIDGLGTRLSRRLNGEQPGELAALATTIRQKDPTYDLNRELVAYLIHANAAVRVIAAENVSFDAASNEDVVSRIVALLGDNCAECRIAAATALQRNEFRKDVVDQLVRAFKIETEEKVRLTIAESVQLLHRKGRD